MCDHVWIFRRDQIVALAAHHSRADHRLSSQIRAGDRSQDRHGIETMKGPAESGQICSVGRRKTAKKIAKNKRCYANTLRPRSRMLLKVMKGG
jgi:hypothetical protein